VTYRITPAADGTSWRVYCLTGAGSPRLFASCPRRIDAEEVVAGLELLEESIYEPDRISSASGSETNP